MKKERNTKIDILRAIAMICIIIAHSKPDALTFQLRNFDVIMIVILLGASFQLSMHHLSHTILTVRSGTHAIQ